MTRVCPAVGKVVMEPQALLLLLSLSSKPFDKITSRQLEPLHISFHLGSGPSRAKRMNERDRRRFRVASDNVQERERPARGRRRRRNMGRRLLRAVSLSQTLQNITKSSHINCMSQMNLIKSSCQLPTREISSQWNVEWKGDGGRQAGRPPPTLFVPPLGLTCIKTFLWSGVILAFC